MTENEVGVDLVHPDDIGVEFPQEDGPWRLANTEAGEAVISLDQPCLFTVDINRQMDDQDTGKLPMNRGVYEGPLIHTLTIYATPTPSWSTSLGWRRLGCCQ